MALRFDIVTRATDCHARLGRVTTAHGSFDTPAFMPVGTQGTVKGLLPWDVAGTGAQIILGNTYHLMLRPGSELVAAMGGLHRWMNWPGPILTDSGGFQVFSLSDINRITDDGVVFKSHLDGSTIDLTPERSMRVQNELGADIIMQFDDCPPAEEQEQELGQGARGKGLAEGEPGSTGGPSSNLKSEIRDQKSSPPARTRLAAERSARWLDRCVAAHARPAEQSLFAIVQGGTDLELRSWSVNAVRQHDLPGYAIGGVAVGEGFEGLKLVVEHTAPLLPENKPRYLMGVGYERDILTAVRAGVDMFDCVLPTRNGRNATAFTPTGRIKLRNAKYARDEGPIDETCDCPACGGLGVRGSGFAGKAWGATAAASATPDTRHPTPGIGFSRSYLRHLFLADEMLGPILVSLHNIRHFQRYLLDIRRAIPDNDWSLVARRWPVAFS